MKLYEFELHFFFKLNFDILFSNNHSIESSKDRDFRLIKFLMLRGYIVVSKFEKKLNLVVSHSNSIDIRK